MKITVIYDSGSNVSLINAKLLKIKQENTDNLQGISLKTINGAGKTRVKIYNIEKTMKVFIVDSE